MLLNQIDIQDIIKIAKDAGKVIMEIYNKDFGVEFKTDSTPLTIADQKANEIIVASLNQLPVNSFLQKIFPYYLKKEEMFLMTKGKIGKTSG